MSSSSSKQFLGVARRVRVGALTRVGPEPLQVAWLNQDLGEHAVGLGVAGEGDGEVRWVDAPAVLPPGPWFGGWAFDAARPWAGFPAERWILPEVLVWWAGGEAWVAAFGPEARGRAPLEARLEQLAEQEPSTEAVAATALPAERGPWDRLVTEALAAISSGALRKVVVARELRVVAERPFDERRVLKALEATQRGCHVFFFRGEDGAAFVGATPELLLDVRDGLLRTEALAGSAPLGGDAALLRSAKDLEEHQLVVDALVDRLAPFVRQLERPAGPAIKALPRLVHLHTPMRGALAPGVTPEAVRQALHPTPAVCGTPTDAARAWLAAHEGFARGWYAGGIAARGPGRFTAFVALRSSLLRNREAVVFAGAGIVRGSSPAAEWEETERKARAMMDGLGVGTHG